MLQVKPGKNPLDENNLTGIASLLDYRLYSEQISNVIVLPRNDAGSQTISNDETLIAAQDESHQTYLMQRGCDWCCCWNPCNN